jgi:GntR family transcriptional regulator
VTRPVHLSIRDDLRMRITAGEWNAGQRLPSETELAAWYGVARMTIRHAVGALAAEGVVVRRQGIGTFAAEPVLAARAGFLQSYAEEMREQGRDVQATLIKSVMEQPPAGARVALGLGDSAVAIFIRRLRTVDGVPTLVQNSWLPYSRFAGLEADPLRDGSLFAMLEGPYGVRITRARQQLGAAAATEADARLLGLLPRDPVLRIIRTTYDCAGLAIEYSASTMRPGVTVDSMIERWPEREDSQ